MIAVARHLPRLAARVPWVPLGDWPTPLLPLDIGGRPVWVKHEGDSNATYGGNKIRTLEVWLGHAQAAGAKRIWAIGAYGSNHAIATIVHAPRAGLEAAAIVFPQPTSAWAVENCGAIVASGCPIVRLHTVAEVPFAAAWIARRERDAVVMPPGGATTVGTFGAMSAAFELAEQIAAGAAPPPRRIVVPIGSTCTTAGLLAGMVLAHAVGVWRWPVPIVHGVRVTPWPVTSRLLIAQLAARTLDRVAQLGGPTVAIGLPEIYARLVVDGRELGPGYGRVTGAATAAMTTLTGGASGLVEGSHGHGRDDHDDARRDGLDRRAPLDDRASDVDRQRRTDDASELDERPRASRGRDDGPAALDDAPRLDGVYSGKAAAALLRLHRAGVGPLVFWASKSTTVMAAPTEDALAAAPDALRAWLRS